MMRYVLLLLTLISSVRADFSVIDVIASSHTKDNGITLGEASHDAATMVGCNVQVFGGTCKDSSGNHPVIVGWYPVLKRTHWLPAM